MVAAPLATMDTSFLVIEPHIMPDYLKKAFHLILLSSYHSQNKIDLIKNLNDNQSILLIKSQH